jgi:hypothetical protein
VQDEVVGISLRRRDQLKPDVVWDVLWKVIQSNARFGLTDRLEVHLDHVRMPTGNSRAKTKGRSLDVLSATKRSIVIVKAAFLCLPHALIIAMAHIPKSEVHELGDSHRTLSMYCGRYVCTMSEDVQVLLNK